MNKDQLTIAQLFDLNHTIACRLMPVYTYPWEVIPHISEFIMQIGAVLPQDQFEKHGQDIWIHKDAKLHRPVAMGGPLIICQGAEIRPGAFIRGSAIIGANCVIGNSTELKNVILFDRVQVPHYNYVGDSILGYRAHMGAGAITSNVKADKTLVHVHPADGDIETGLKKFGAILGDGADIGCNSVLNPGTIIGKNSNVYPLSSVRGCVPADSIYKAKDDIVSKEER